RGIPRAALRQDPLRRDELGAHRRQPDGQDRPCRRAGAQPRDDRPHGATHLNPLPQRTGDARRRYRHMAMFDYFPNYVWNLSISIAMASGGELGEIMDMCQPLLEKAQAGEDAGTGAFLAEWMKV